MTQKELITHLRLLDLYKIIDFDEWIKEGKKKIEQKSEERVQQQIIRAKAIK